MFCDRLREERLRLKLTQREFAERCGVQLNAQGKYERGLRSPNSDYLTQAALLGVDVEYLITGQVAAQKSALLDFLESLDDNAQALLLQVIEPIQAAISNKKTPS